MTRRCCLTLVVFGCLAGGGIARSDDQRAADGNFSGSLVIEFDRNAGEVLTTAKSDLADGRTTAGLRRLQGLLERTSDVLVDDGSSYVSLRQLVNEQIGRLPREDLQAYQRIVRVQSEAALQAACNPLDPAALVSLTERYRHTPVALQSAQRLAILAFDRGDARGAAVWAGFLRRHFPSYSLPEAIGRGPQPPDTPVENSAGTANHTSSWRLELGLAEAARHAVDGAIAELNAQTLTPILTCRPLILDRRIVARTLTGLVCVDADSGEPLWEHPIADHAARLASAPGTIRDPIRSGQVSAVLLRRLIRDSLEDELATDGESVFTILTPSRTDDDDPDWPANILRAVDLTTGRTRWEFAPPLEAPRRGRRRSASDRQIRYFLGPPLIHGEELLLPAQHGQNVELVAVDRHTGQVRWSVVIGQVVRDLWTRNKPGLEDPSPEDRERQSTACRLSRSGSRVLFPTGAGVIACVDLTQRRLMWACRYARRNLSAPPPAAGDETHFREMPTRDAFVLADSWIIDEVGVCLAPDADRVLAFDLRGGRMLWSRPRGDFVQLLPTASGAMLLVSDASVVAIRARDGAVEWSTDCRRPVGRGITFNDRLILPLSGGKYDILRISDGTRNLDRNHEEFNDVNVSMHPPPSMRPVPLRNLHGSADVILCQSASRLERIAPAATSGSPSAAQTGPPLESLLSPLAGRRAAAAQAMNALRKIDSRIRLADGLLVRLLEQTGLKRSIEQQAATLLSLLRRAGNDQDTEAIHRIQRQLAALNAHRLYVTSPDGLHTCRLDRWIGHLDETDADTRANNPAGSTGNRDSPGPHSHWPWPETTPRLSESQTSFGLSYLQRVPIQEQHPGVWSDVTVAVDRQGRMVQLQDPSCARPAKFLLPRSADTFRLQPRFLQAWAAGDVLLVRVGVELMAFRRTRAGELPASTLWPAEAQTLPLLGDRAPLPTSVRELPEESIAAWETTTAGFEDVFGRRIGNVGPVRSEYFCYQRRGDIVALQTDSGEELWRRGRWPVGTRCIGDDEALVVFHPRRPQVTVLAAADGRTHSRWNLDALPELPPVTEQSPFAPRQINGALALMAVSGPDEPLLLQVLDMAQGRLIWSRTFPTGAIDFAVDEARLGLALPPSAEGECTLKLLDWKTGEPTGEFELAGPPQLQSVQTFSDARRRYVILSGRITDLPLQNVRQIHDGLHRPLVNGWLHAFDVDAREVLWSRPLENVAFSIVQPRHVPLLVINDMSRLPDIHTPQGRLICLDAQTGGQLVEVRQPTHVYYTLRAAPDAARIDIRLRGRTLRLNYRDEPASPPP